MIASPVFAMVTTTKDPGKCKIIDSMQVKKYIGCCILKTITYRLINSKENYVKASLEGVVITEGEV